MLHIHLFRRNFLFVTNLSNRKLQAYAMPVDKELQKVVRDGNMEIRDGKRSEIV